VPSVAELAATLADPDTGLTAHTRRFSRVDALAAVADALPTGAESIEQIEALTDQVLAAPQFVALPAKDASAGTAGGRAQLAAGHMRNADRYTTNDIVAGERAILGTAAVSRPDQHPARVDPAQAELAAGVVEAAAGYPLSAEQRTVLTALVTSGRAVDAAVGRALDAAVGPPGSGKTTLMRAARVAWEAGGFTVAGAATQAVACRPRPASPPGRWPAGAPGGPPAPDPEA
jgi:hypothetical protein